MTVPKDPKGKRAYFASAKAKQRAKQGGLPQIAQTRGLQDAIAEVAAARREWDDMLAGLSRSPSVHLLRGQMLPTRLDRAIVLLGEVLRGALLGKRPPGRPAGEMAKAVDRLRERIKELRADYDDGMPMAGVMEEKYGVSHVTIRKFAKDEGWPPRDVRQPRWVPPEEREPVKVPAKKPAVRGKAGKRR
jgi:hypothetical protein